MVIRFTLFGLILLLIGVVIITFFSMKEGFVDSTTPRVIVTRLCTDGQNINIYARSTQPTMIRIVYRTDGSPVDATHPTDNTLGNTQIRVDTTESIIATPSASSLTEGKLYYIVPYNAGNYTGSGSAPLGLFVYRPQDVLSSCSLGPKTDFTPLYLPNSVTITKTCVQNGRVQLYGYVPYAMTKARIFYTTNPTATTSISPSNPAANQLESMVYSITTDDSAPFATIAETQFTLHRTYYVVPDTKTSYTGNPTELMGSFIYGDSPVITTLCTSVTLTSKCKTGTGPQEMVNLFGKTTGETVTVKIFFQSSEGPLTTNPANQLLGSTYTLTSTDTTPFLTLPKTSFVQGRTYYIVPSTETDYRGDATKLYGTYVYQESELATTCSAVRITRFCYEDATRQRIRLYGKTTMGTVNVVIAYRSTPEAVDATHPTNQLLQTAAVSVLPDESYLFSVEKAKLVEDKTYYIIPSTKTSYSGALSELLGTFTFRLGNVQTSCEPSTISSTVPIYSDLPVIPPSRDLFQFPTSTRVSPSQRDVPAQVSLSQQGVAATELQQRVAQQAAQQTAQKNQLLSERALALPSVSSQPSSTASIQQGAEFKKSIVPVEDEYRCPTRPDGSCPPMPDMSQYIRKDQIPCWNCAVDY